MRHRGCAGSRFTLLRGSGLLAAAAWSSILIWWLTSPPLEVAWAATTAVGGRGLTGLPFGDVLAAGCATALLGCWAWLLGTSAVVVAQTLAGSPTTRLCPVVLQRAVLAACGLALSAAIALPAQADQGTPGRLTGLAVPDRTVGDAQAARGPRPVITVRTGDNLWTIAERLLPGHAATREVAQEWLLIEHANRDRLGDPDLIYPGDRLRIPREEQR